MSGVQDCVECKVVNTEWQIGEIEGITLKTYVTLKKGTFKRYWKDDRGEPK